MTLCSLKELLAKILSTPLVIETGTSGIWTYRKWSDGTMEMFGYQTCSSMTYAANGGYGWYAIGKWK